MHLRVELFNDPPTIRPKLSPPIHLSILVSKEFFQRQTKLLGECLQNHDWTTAEVLREALSQAWKEKRAVFICGNGGSSANANHWANDFLYPVSKKIGSGLRLHSLVANPSVLTCLANDEGYERVLSAQLEVQASPGDLLIALSGSGNSPNIVQALKTARTLGMRSFAVLGFSGGEALKLADVAIHFHVSDMQLVEDFQLILGHLLMRSLSAPA
jgi:D-sedoheptulose 7-phosphate isomerase